jgi:hypothetical protein
LFDQNAMQGEKEKKRKEKEIEKCLCKSEEAFVMFGIFQ